MSDFVNFKLAQKLKEKGYPQHWSDNDYIVENEYEDNFEIGAYYDRCLIPEHIVTIAAPTISQVLKWLREEKKIVFGITPMQEMDSDYLGWCITIYKVADDGYGLSWQEELYYDSYESSAIAGIEYVIDNLI